VFLDLIVSRAVVRVRVRSRSVAQFRCLANFSGIVRYTWPASLPGELDRISTLYEIRVEIEGGDTPLRGVGGPTDGNARVDAELSLVFSASLQLLEADFRVPRCRSQFPFVKATWPCSSARADGP
jgi:hypothetical protein